MGPGGRGSCGGPSDLMLKVVAFPRPTLQRGSRGMQFDTSGACKWFHRVGVQGASDGGEAEQVGRGWP